MPQLYAIGLAEVARLDLGRANLWALLVRDTYRFDRGHAALDDESGQSPAAHEVAVEGYVRQALEDQRLVEDGSRLYLDARDLDFGELGPGERLGGLVLFREAGSDRLSPPIAFYEIATTGGRGVPTTGGAVTYAWAAAGRVLVIRERT
jgi:hypothetical protein